VRERGQLALIVASPPLLLMAALTVAACSPVPPTPTPPVVTSAPSTSASAPALPASPERSTETSTVPGASAAVELDPALLSILPSAVDGAAVTAEPDSFPDAAADPDFAANVQAAVFAVVVDGGDLASGVVARLRPGVYSDAFFRDWRDTYNQGACAQAGGVVGNAEAELGGRTVHITSCAGGLLVYHAYLPERDVLISLFSLGDRRFGEQLMRDLRP